jgi:hypothetical protein
VKKRCNYKSRKFLKCHGVARPHFSNRSLKAFNYWDSAFLFGHKGLNINFNMNLIYDPHKVFTLFATDSRSMKHSFLCISYVAPNEHKIVKDKFGEDLEKCDCS